MFSSIRQRRATFCVLTLQGYTTKCIYDDLVLRRSMYLETAGMSDDELNEELLEDLQNRISVGGRSLAVYGLPSPLTKKNEVEYYRMKFPRKECLRYYNELTEKYPLNQEQYDVYNQIITTVMGQSKDDERKMFFLNANAGICILYNILFMVCNVVFVLMNICAGCGKTTIAKTIAAYLRSLGKIVLICASTGLAAQNYPNDASTAHQLFNIPVVEMELRDVADDPIECNLHWMEERVDLLQKCDVIIWDEFPSCERMCFEAIVRNCYLKELSGKVFIGLGKIFDLFL